MAVVSEGTLYQARIAPSYVSSSGYYGYVPPCPIADYENLVVHQQQLGRVVEANDQTASIDVTTGDRGWKFSSTSFPMPATIDRQQRQHEQHICFNGSAMETDEDDNCRSEYVDVSRCQNNHCVIPEAAGRLDGSYRENFYRVVEQETDARRRGGNRKRNSAGDPAYLFAGQPPANHAKRSRQDGGNGNVRHGIGSTGKRGSSAMRYESTSLSGNADIGVCRLSEICQSAKTNVDDDCRTAAGNYYDIGVSERPCIVTTNGHEKFGDSYLDYEIMLMETHGCSSYHYDNCRFFNVDVTEAEF